MKKRLGILLALTLLMGSIATAFATEENTLPISGEKINLTMYTKLWNGVEQLIADYNESPTVQRMEALTGVHFDFVYPPVGDDGSAFNILIASNDYPDIFLAPDEIGSYPGGMDGAIEDGILMDHTELVEQYASNYMAIYNGLSDKDKLNLKSDGGVYKLGDFLAPVLEGKQHTGLVIRKDWLDALGLAVPTTYAEFEAVLAAFKENYSSVVAPYAMAGFDESYVTEGEVIGSGYGVGWKKFLLNDGLTVTHSYLQAGYKEMLSTLRSWMQNGLIDVDCINRTHDDAKKMLYTGQTGVVAVGNWEVQEMLSLGKLEDPAFELTAVPILRKSDADEALHLSQIKHTISGRMRFFLSSTCKDPVAAIRWIDSLYSADINLLNMYGVGELPDGHRTYDVDENGVYSYSDWLKNNPDYPFATYRNLHFIQYWTTMGLDDAEMSQYDAPINQNCWDTWSHNVDDQNLIPKYVSMSADESRTTTEIMNEIDTFVSENALKIICDELPLDAWDEIAAKLPGMRIDEAIANWQAAYDRYLAR